MRHFLSKYLQYKIGNTNFASVTRFEASLIGSASSAPGLPSLRADSSVRVKHSCLICVSGVSVNRDGLFCRWKDLIFFLPSFLMLFPSWQHIISTAFCRSSFFSTKKSKGFTKAWMKQMCSETCKWYYIGKYLSLLTCQVVFVLPREPSNFWPVSSHWYNLQALPIKRSNIDTFLQ